MAEIRPLRAVRYEPSAVGSLDAVAAPPYDVIDDEMRAKLVSKSPFNVVEIDLPVADDGGDPYLHAQTTYEHWLQQGILVREREDSIWALTQSYEGPDGNAYTRHGFFARVRVEDYGPGRIRPHERTHPGPKEDRLNLTRATRANLSPIFSLFPDPEDAAWSALEPHTQDAPFDEVRDDDGTDNRLWRITDPDTIDAVRSVLADKELLIADGHHRYETARVYAEEVGGEGEHQWVLMFLCSLSDPGLTIFPTHRLLTDLKTREVQERLGKAIKEHFEIEPIEHDELEPPRDLPGIVMGYMDSFHKQGYPADAEAGRPPHARHARPREPDPARHARHDRRRHRPQARARLLEGHTRRGRGRAQRPRRRRLLHARHSGRAGARGGGRGRVDAAEVDLLLPQDPYGLGL